MAAATVLSTRTSPRDPAPRLVAITIDVFIYRCETTGNNADAASPGSGKYPRSSITNKVGPA